MISFTFNPEKMASAVAYVVQERPGLTKGQIGKLLYFADKQHLLEYGRPITGDVYKAVAQGHIPSNGLNMIDRNACCVGSGAVECLAKYGELVADRVFVLKNAPNMRVFSKSDRRVLDQVLETLGNLSAPELEKKSYAEPSWKMTPENGIVPFELFFEGHPEATPIKDALLENVTPQ